MLSADMGFRYDTVLFQLGFATVEPAIGFRGPCVGARSRCLQRCAADCNVALHGRFWLFDAAAQRPLPYRSSGARGSYGKILIEPNGDEPALPKFQVREKDRC